MDYIDIKYALAKKGYTLTAVARELDLYGPQSVQQVLTRKYYSHRVERRVSEITGLPLHDLFPDRYAKGKLIKKPRKQTVLVYKNEKYPLS